jgi:ABC-type uncharacterized transport system substrate-binding protein
MIKGDMIRAIILTLTAFFSSPALAHPHLFMDTGIKINLDDQSRAVGITIDWSYDDFSSLQYIADMGLDPDGDGRLTDAERAKLSGFDMGWEAGFAGDTYALLSDAAIGLLGPSNWASDYTDGRIHTVYTRDFAKPIPRADLPKLIVQVYDPSFYTAYSLVAGSLSKDVGCQTSLHAPDRSQADQVLLDALAEYTPNMDVEADFPAIGAAFSEEVQITCAG